MDGERGKRRRAGAGKYHMTMDAAAAADTFIVEAARDGGLFFAVCVKRLCNYRMAEVPPILGEVGGSWLLLTAASVIKSRMGV